MIAQVNSQSILIYEDFESGDFASKGWYDGFDDQRTDTESKFGSYSYEGRFFQGATTAGAGRHLFTPTEKVYMSYWVKYSANYVGSGVGYHPHEWNILTNKDWAYQGPADTYLTAYVEQHAGRPLLALQDSKNVDPGCILLNNNSFVGCNGDFDSYEFTENRSVCSCNGLIGDVDRRDCFSSAGSSHGYYSARAWAADSVYFRHEPGPYYKNDWHHVEVLFDMNTIENNVGIPNGKIRYWLDGQLLIRSDSILFRTAVNADMQFNQLFYGPYIGVGSPVDQTWWVDELIIADDRIATSVPFKPTNQFGIDLAPNPVMNEIIIRIHDQPSNIQQVDIFSSDGRLIHREDGHGSSVQLDFPFTGGLYIIHVTDDTGKSYLCRVIKMD
jgi:hypothetical protein